MTVTLMPEEKILMQKESNTVFHHCVNFEVPLVEHGVFELEVKVEGATFHSMDVKKVMAKVYKPRIFIQTDKPIYLPGQTVHFRVVTLDSQLRPLKEVYDLVELQDPTENRVAQWLNATSNSKILQLSYSLNPEAREGSYQLLAKVDGRQHYYNFVVEKSVLPKFDVEVKTPQRVSIGKENVEVTACSKYTYGQPVPGQVKLMMCRPLNNYYYGSSISIEEVILPECYNETKEADKEGCAAFAVPMKFFKKLDSKILRDRLHLSVEVEEEGTGITRKYTNNIGIDYSIGKLLFIDTPKLYEQGSTLEGKVKAVHYNDTPIADMDLYLFKGPKWSGRHIQNLTTDLNGIAEFSLNTTSFLGTVTLAIDNTMERDYKPYGTPYFEEGVHEVSVVQASSPDIKTVSSVKVKSKDKPLSCEEEENFSVEYTVVGEKPSSATLMFLVLSRGTIVSIAFREFDVNDQRVTEGELSFKLYIRPEMAPEIQVVVYTVLPSETVLADSADFSTEKCFKHKVSLEFSKYSLVPGEESNMQVSADADSLCGISAIDQSVLIKERRKVLDAEKLFQLLPVTKINHIPYTVTDEVRCLHVRPKRSIWPYPGEGDDAFTVFKNVGLKMLTNLFVQMPPCLKFRGREYTRGTYHRRVVYADYDGMVSLSRMAAPQGPVLGISGSAMNPIEPEPIVTVRNFFPETWIWDLVEVGSAGVKDVSLTVPDTITTWETEAFCLSSQGIGLAPRKNITVFQPFFLELTLPYSIIRGEHFELKATTFNYLSSCIMVSVKTKDSPDYTLTPLSGDRYTSCLCGRERKTLKWKMDASSLGVMNVTVSAEAVESHVSCNNDIVSVPERGRIDVVTRSLIVKAEGVEMSKTHNLLLCPKGTALTEDVEMQLPENVIVGSARATLSVLGDILGRALKNLDGLLRMPYGCGEQNMALLAPNIYILHYLKNTDQLTPAILDKATNFLNSGYQRQLNYRHSDGAFSTFGKGRGNTWLTAFVMRTFAKAKTFIYIDPKVIKKTKSWLKQRQQENGCFQMIGTLFNNRMKGGVSDEVTLTAYITAAFLEMKIDDNEMMNNSISCLKNSTNNLSNTYTTALLAYVFTLAGDMETRAQLLQHLDSVALKKGGFLHWAQTSQDTSSSLSVEISSYVILAKLSASPTSEDLGYVSGIVRWLTGQQNYYGGFSSTQDTVVALQALALYSTLVYSPDGSSTVTVQSPSGELTFDVNQNNKLLYQEKILQDTTGKYSVEVKGNSCASIQLSLHYNIPTPKASSVFNINVTTQSTCQANSGVTLKMESLYKGEEPQSNMVILDIKMLSGFIPNPESLTHLKRSLFVDRVDNKEDHILVYLEKLPKDISIFHTLNIIREQAVENLKPAVVAVYDYYQPQERAETEYTLNCYRK
uniref:Alpha-2-macroglobulin-like n=2 Tax=Cynoglossus semilaevis TaxID=244447 RepID=A0A3P8V405_CYNSE